MMSNLTSTDHEASEDNLKPSKYQPILKWNALDLCVQALLYPIAVFIYLLIGAVIFTAIEYDHEKMAMLLLIKKCMVMNYNKLSNHF